MNFFKLIMTGSLILIFQKYIDLLLYMKKESKIYND